MPYIVTTKRSDDARTALGRAVTRMKQAPGSESRRAVATLEEARLVAYAQVGAQRPDTADWSEWMAEANLLPESGGTVGPLPDGTRIEVQQVGWVRLARDAGAQFHSGDQRSPARRAELVDAYNAREAAT